MYKRQIVVGLLHLVVPRGGNISHTTKAPSLARGGVEIRSDLAPKLEIIIARRLRIGPISYLTEETVSFQHSATSGIEGVNH